jgi:AcrR family transcriptional regulator
LQGRPDILAGEVLTKPPSQKRSRGKREALVASASELFAQHGFEATGIEAIAARAGIAVGGFYQHFASKRQLLLVLMDTLLRDLEGLDFAPAGPGASSRETVETLVRTGLQVDWAHSGVYRAWREAVLTDARVAEADARVARWTRGRIAAALTVVAGLPGARRDVNVAVLAAVLDALFWRVAETPVEERPAVTETVVDLIVHAVLHD